MSAFVDITFVFVPLVLWILSATVEGNDLTGDFLWQFIIEWVLVGGQIFANFMFMGGLADWYYFNVKGYLEDGWCNPKY